MAIKYTPATPERSPICKWFFSVVWMSGDADAYETVKYDFDTEKDFLDGYNFFKKIMNFKARYHNLYIDLSRYCTLEELQTRYYYQSMNPECMEDVKKFLGEHKHLHDMFEAAGFETERDVTCEDMLASPDEIKDIVYYDLQGTKFDVTFTD